MASCQLSRNRYSRRQSSAHQIRGSKVLSRPCSCGSALVIQPPKTVQRRDYSVPRASMPFRCFDSAFDRNLATFLGALVSVSRGKTLLRRCRSCAGGGGVWHTALYL